MKIMRFSLKHSKFSFVHKDEKDISGTYED